MKNGKPVLAFCGWGRAGKDTCSEWFRDHTELVFKGGCSYTILPRVAEARGETLEYAWATRHQNREWWYEFCNEYRKHDPTRLVRDCLEHSDVVCGIRDDFELKAVLRANLVDLAIWVNRPGIEKDKTVTYQEKDCDISIHNSGSIEDLHRKLERLAVSLGVKVLTKPSPRVE